MTAIPVNGRGALAGVEPALTAYRPPEGRLCESGTTSAHLCTLSSPATLRAVMGRFRLTFSLVIAMTS
jgi:hypothetical protein